MFKLKYILVYSSLALRNRYGTHRIAHNAQVRYTIITHELIDERERGVNEESVRQWGGGQDVAPGGDAKDC
jgi:hypothetical protein